MRLAIERKRDGDELSPAQWDAIVGAYMDGAVDDAQMAALAMACVFRGMGLDEITALTGAMAASGEALTFHAENVVDKHSSGGVGDSVSLIAVPIVAACGGRVAKLSGRALGHTGGTIDKLEAIPGCSAALSMEAFIAQVERIGCAIAMQTDAFVPADKRLYRLRDRTGTVPSVGLIAASILSKKLAGGAEAFVFDVKCGTAAFMKDIASARALAQTLVEVARRCGRAARAFVTDMNEPLGTWIGTGLEIVGVRDVLRGLDGDSRLRELSVRIASAMLEAAGVADAPVRAEDALRSGAAYEKFVEMIEAQGARRASLEALAPVEQRASVRAASSGFIGAIDAVALGNQARALSAGDACAGIRVRVRIGDPVRTGDVLAECYGTNAMPEAIAGAFHIIADQPPSRPLIYDDVTG